MRGSQAAPLAPSAASPDHRLGLHIARVPGAGAADAPAARSRRSGNPRYRLLHRLCRGQTCLEQEIEHAHQTPVLTLLGELDL